MLCLIFHSPKLSLLIAHHSEIDGEEGSLSLKKLESNFNLKLMHEQAYRLLCQLIVAKAFFESGISIALLYFGIFQSKHF